MNLYHRIISSVYLRVPRHLFWYAAIFFRCHARCLGLRSHAHAAAAPASYARASGSVLIPRFAARTQDVYARPSTGAALLLLLFFSLLDMVLVTSASRRPHVRLSDRCHLDLLNYGYCTSTRSPDRWRTLESVDRHGAAATRLLLAPSAWF